MIQKLKQIWNDHKAMQIVRSHFGDLELTSLVGGKFKEGYECRIFQHDWYVEDPSVKDPDPAVAIIKVFEKWNKEPMPPTSGDYSG